MTTDINDVLAPSEEPTAAATEAKLSTGRGRKKAAQPETAEVPAEIKTEETAPVASSTDVSPEETTEASVEDLHKDDEPEAAESTPDVPDDGKSGDGEEALVVDTSKAIYSIIDVRVYNGPSRTAKSRVIHTPVTVYPSLVYGNFVKVSYTVAGHGHTYGYIWRR